MGNILLALLLKQQLGLTIGLIQLGFSSFLLKYFVGLGTLFLFEDFFILSALSIDPPMICFFSSLAKFPFSDVTIGKLRVFGILYPSNEQFSNQEELFDEVYSLRLSENYIFFSIPRRILQQQIKLSSIKWHKKNHNFQRDIAQTSPNSLRQFFYHHLPLKIQKVNAFQFKSYNFHSESIGMMQDENCCAQFQEVYQLNKSAQDMIFDQIIAEMQEIVIGAEFESSMSTLMKQNSVLLSESNKKDKESQAFLQYSKQVKTYIQNKIRRKVPQFDWAKFQILFKTRKNFVDQQLSDTLLSLEDIEYFKAFVKDFKSSVEEEQMFKVLTIKSNKISQNKKVKGKTNIFAQGQNQADLFGKGLNIQPIKRKPAHQKTEQQLLVPDLILTVKGLRKK